MTAIVLRGDARSLPLPDGCADLIVTSPPYFGLRSYTDGGTHYGGQIGSEATPQEWVAALLACTAEWMRVLKPSGSIFVNLGDKYSGAQQQTHGRQSLEASSDYWRRTDPKRTGVPAKSLLGLPWRYALACTDQLGLILRAEIIWAKPNGLPESVQDRVRRSHEQVFHFTRQPRYYAAVDEIREPHARQYSARDYETLARRVKNRPASHVNTHGNASTYHDGAEFTDVNPLGKLPGSVWNIPSAPLTVPPHLGVDHFAAFPPELPRRIILGWSPPGICTACGEGRRPVADVEQRDDVAPAGPKHMVRYSSKSGLGKGYLHTVTGYACACTPHTDHDGTGEWSGPSQAAAITAGAYPLNSGGEPRDTSHPGHAGLWDRPKVGPWREYHFDAWTPPPTRPALVVDPFSGTGTSMLVAAAYGRIGIGVDLSADYCRLAEWRCSDPGEIARALKVDKPPVEADGQEALFDRQEALWA